MIPTAGLGRSGAAFTRLGLGTWAIGGPWRFGWGPVDDAESIAAIRRAVNEGINWIDTAAVYGLGHSEEIVGRALRGYATGDEPFVCTKCGRKTRSDGTPYGDLRAQSIRDECEASLRRLGVERIDLYQIHWPDPNTETPLEESWSAMAQLVDEGKVRWIGVSNFNVDQLERCEAIRHVDSLQPQLSMVQRGALQDVIPWAAPHQTGVIVYSPMASGLLSGSFDRGRLESLPSDDMRLRRPEFAEPWLSKNLALVERLRAIAHEFGCVRSPSLSLHGHWPRTASLARSSAPAGRLSSTHGSAPATWSSPRSCFALSTRRSPRPAQDTTSPQLRHGHRPRETHATSQRLAR